ncbi:MAG: hypothetical protein ACRC9U_02170, partial [Metamycoplasmataceae bacterium]
MIKKNKKKALLGLGVGITTASAITLPALLLGLNQESLNLNNSKNYVDSSWKDTKIHSLDASPISWTNNTVLPVDYEGNRIKDIFDVYNYGTTGDITNPSTKFLSNLKGEFEIFLSPSGPLYNEFLNNSTNINAGQFINLQASKIDITSLKSSNITYTNMANMTARSRNGSTNWAGIPFGVPKREITLSTDRLVKLLMRKPFGEDDAFAKKAYGSNPPQGLTYITQPPSGSGVGTIPEKYNQPGNGTNINPSTQPLLNMATGFSAAAAKIQFMVLDLIVYMDVNNQWNILPNPQNSSTTGNSAITKGAIDESKFDKKLSAKEALEKVINEKTKFLNFSSTNAPKFWDETSTITAQYNDQSGKIKIIFSVKQDIDTTKKYSDRAFQNQQHTVSSFKSIAGLNDADGKNLIKAGTYNFEYEISGFQSTFDANSYLIEKSGANKKVLPSTINNNQASNYVNIYQNNVINNVLPSDFELTVTGKDNALGQAVFSIYDKVNKTVFASIIIKGFKTSNVSKPVTDPIAIIEDDKTSNSDSGTVSVRPYSNNWLVGGNSTNLTEQGLLNSILNKQVMIRPTPVPYNNGLLIISANMPSKFGNQYHNLTLLSREGKIISSAAFRSYDGKEISVIDVTYDSLNKQAIVWFRHSLKLSVVVFPLNESTGQFSSPNRFELVTYNRPIDSAQLTTNLAIVPIPNIDKTEYWIVNRSLISNNNYTPTHQLLANHSNLLIPLVRVQFGSGSATSIKRWDVFKDRFVAALKSKPILVSVNPSNTTTVAFTDKSVFKIHNISSNFINGNEYLGVDFSISFDGTTYEHGNNIHHVLFKFSSDSTNPLTTSPIMVDNNWTITQEYSASVSGFSKAKFSDVSLISTVGSSILNYNNPVNSSQINNANRKGWFSHGSFYSQNKSYNALTMVLQSSFNRSPNTVVISGTTESSASMDFSIPTGYFNDSTSNNNSPQVLQQPYWQKGKLALNIRNSGFTFDSNAGTSAPANDPTSNGKEFKEISFNDVWASTSTGNSGGARFTSKKLGTINSSNKGPYNSINIATNENGEDITSMLYISNEAKLQINPNWVDVINGLGQSQLRINTLKTTTPIWNTNSITNPPKVLDARNVFSIIDVKNLTSDFKYFVAKEKVFADYIVPLNDVYTLPLVIKGNPTWNTGNTELTVKFSFPKYYENGVLKTYNENTSPTIDVKIRNVNSPTLNISKLNLAKITFTGNTKNIVIANEEQALVSGNGDSAQTALIKTNVDILYNLNALSSTEWYKKDDFIKALSISKINFFKSDIDSIKIKYAPKPNSDYTISDNTDQLVSPAQITGLLPFMHMDTYYEALIKIGPDGIGVTGSDSSNITAITWPFKTDGDFTKIIAAGIKFQWTNDPNHADNRWVNYDFAAGANNKIDIGTSSPYLAVRIFADNTVTFDQANYGKPVTVTPKNIKVLVNLSEADLEKIVFGGDTKNLTINTNAITNLPSLNSVVDLQFSVGWDLDNNTVSDPNKENWYSQSDLIGKLKILPQSLFIKRADYPTDFTETFKLKARFVIKKGIPNEGNYIFVNDLKEVNHTYTEAEKLTIKNYVDISGLQKQLETAKITFGVNDKLNSVTELNIASVTDAEKTRLKTLGIQLEYAFGPSNPTAYTQNWNTPFTKTENLGSPATIWLRFVVLDSSKTLTEIFNSSWTHKAVEPQIEKPKFIDLDGENLKKTLLLGTTVKLEIDEKLSLVPNGTNNTQAEVSAHIDIIYNINNIKLDLKDQTKEWFTKTELDLILPTYPHNIFPSDLQNVTSKYRVKPTSENDGWKISDIPAQLVNAGNVKSFIHTLSYFEILRDKRVSIEGSATNVTDVIFPRDFDKNAFKILQTNGIVLQWTTKKTGAIDSDWFELIFDDLNTYPKDIGVNPYLGMRITTKQSNITTDTAVNNVVIDVTPLSITIVYSVDSQILINNLTPNGNTKKITTLDETSSLKGQYPDYDHLEIRYKIGTSKPIELITGKQWYSFTELQNALVNYKGIILPNERQITAKYFLKEGTPLPNPTPPPSPSPYIGYVIKYKGDLEEATLNITNFKSFIDVTQALDNLKKNETSFAPGDSTDKITAIVKTGLTNDEVALLFGTDLEFKAELAIELTNPNFNTHWWQPGKNTNLPPKLPNKDSNGKPVLMWRFALTTITDITFNADDNNIKVSAATQLNVNLPIQVVINTATDYNTIKNSINGNTKTLILEDVINTAAIDAVKTREQLPATAPLQILYAIGGGNTANGLPIDDNDPSKTWFTLAEFKTLLAAKTVDFKTNQIRARFYIDPSYSNAGQTYILSTEAPETIQAEQFTDAAKVKVFINKADYDTLPSKITAVGSADDLTVTIPDELKPTPGPLSPGLELVWSIKENPQLSDITQADNATWTSVVPTTLDPAIKKLSVAYRVKPGYALDPAANKVYSIDTSKIFIYINVQNAWLDQIVFSGNLFEATIDETTFKNNLASIQGGQSVQVQYTVDDKEWLLKDPFIAKLKTLEGALDADNFILLKNKVKARYSIVDSAFQNYRLKVDGTGIIDKPYVEDPRLFKQILLSSANNGFNGYINLSKVPAFDTTGFKITGSNAVPILEFTPLGEKLRAQFAPYQDQASAPFDIYYTTKKGTTGTGEFTIDDKYKIFDATGFKTTGFDPISSSVTDQFFGIKIVARTGYQVYKGGALQATGWSFSVPLSIKTIKDNPFGADKLLVKFNGYQGEGTTNLYTGKTPPELASDVLNKDTDLIDQYYIEFHISNTPLSGAELEKLPDESWIKVGAPNGQGGTIQFPSNLKVGQFVAGRIRMRENSTFEIKDIKVNDSVSTRVIGLKVNESKIVIAAPQLRNNEYSNQSSLIDGDIYINRINVEKDDKDNYLGVDLVLQVKTEFYTRADGNFVLDNNALPIVKRKPTAFYDVIGTDTGDASKDIRIYYTDSTKTIPSDPLETGSIKNLNLTEVPDSLATFIYNLNSGAVDVKQGILFQNQTFTINIKAKKDFVLDGSTAKPLNQTITNAKYPLNTNHNLTMSVQIPDPIKYETKGEAIPQNGKAFITSDTAIKIQFIEDNGNTSNTLQGEEAFKRLTDESKGKLRIQVTLKRKSKDEQFFYNGGTLNLSQLQDLSNGDRILIGLVPSDPNFVLIGPSSSIASWTVNQLEIAAPNTDIFKDLKIVTNINGSDSIWDGQGTFFVAVKTGNGNPPEDLSDELLN